MNANRTFVLGWAVILSLPAVVAAQQSVPPAYNHLEKADSIIGSVITDSHNQHVGRVADLAIDWQAGRVAEVIVDTGGFLTTRERMMAIPPGVLAADADDELRMTGDIDAFDNAPEFDPATWKDSTTPGSVADVYARFHAKAYSPIGPVLQADKIMGMTIRNHENQKLGKLETVVVDLPSGRIPAAIIATAGFLGGKGRLTAVAPAGFYFEPNYDALILDVSRDALKNAPHFKPADWRSSVNNSMNLSAVDDSLKVLHQMTANDDAVIVPDANPQSDVAITELIQRKILIAQDLSIDARHVQVITRKSYVTLRGLADSQLEKQRLGDIAATVVAADHVDNRIEVRVFAAVQ